MLDGILAALTRDADLEWLTIDPTIVWAHQHVAGARKDKKGADAQGLGRSRGGLSTEIHAAGGALRLPVRLIATPGRRRDFAPAHDLIEGSDADAIIADTGYDADHLVQTGAKVVTPTKSNRELQRSYDKYLYGERNAVERFVCKLKQFKRVATRYEKLFANSTGFVKLAAIAIGLKSESVTTTYTRSG